MATGDSVRALKDEYEKLSRANFPFLYKEEIGKLSLKDQLEPIVNGAIEKFEKAISIGGILTEEVVQKLVSIGLAFNNYIIQIYPLKGEDYATKRQEIYDQFTKINQDLLSIWPNVAAVYVETNFATEDIKSLSRTFKANQVEREEYMGHLRDLRSKSDSDARVISELKDRLESELKNFDTRYAELFAKGEILNQERFFLDSADFNQNLSKKWLYIIGILILIFAILIFCFINTCWLNFDCTLPNLVPIKTDRDLLRVFFYYELVKKSLLRILILSLVAFAIKFSVRNYSALKHNHILNRHKANSLSAALNLIQRLPEKSNQESVLTAASKEIFEQHRTGFLQKEEAVIDISVLEKLVGLFKSQSSEKK